MTKINKALFANAALKGQANLKKRLGEEGYRARMKKIGKKGIAKRIKTDGINNLFKKKA